MNPFVLRWRIWSARRAKPVATNALVAGKRVKVSGTATVLEHTMTAPLTRRPAFVWRAIVDEKLRHDTPPGLAPEPLTTWRTPIATVSDTARPAALAER